VVVLVGLMVWWREVVGEREVCVCVKSKCRWMS
jgi:hypothetical protein